jgi:hypothetical protein
LSDSQIVRETLLRLVAEVQNLRVDCAVLEARLAPNPNPADILDVRKAARSKAASDFQRTIEEIRSL